MSTLTTHTSATRATPSSSNIGLCKFNTTTKAIEVSDGTGWAVYDPDTVFIERLLDFFTTSPKLGFSLRKLRGDYTGNAIEVRRSSDNTSQDIGFDSNGNLDTASLESFVGAGNNGFVSKWYDQSGNSNTALMTTASNQPKIVSSGTTITSGTFPAIEFDGTSSAMYTTTNTFGVSGYNLDLTLVAITEPDTSHNSTTVAHIIGTGSSGANAANTWGDALRLFPSGSGKSYGYISESANTGLQLEDITNAADDTLSLALLTKDYSAPLSKISTNDGTVVTDTTTPNGSYSGYTTTGIGVTFGSGTTTSATERFKGKILEIVQWHNDYDSSRTDIKLEINNYYSIW
jgi:hypothetical protein